MPNDTVKVVHDKDVLNLLKNIGVYDQMLQGIIYCAFCNSLITPLNFQGIIKIDGAFRYFCSKDSCFLKFASLKSGE